MGVVAVGVQTVVNLTSPDPKRPNGWSAADGVDLDLLHHNPLLLLHTEVRWWGRCDVVDPVGALRAVLPAAADSGPGHTHPGRPGRHLHYDRGIYCALRSPPPPRC